MKRKKVERDAQFNVRLTRTQMEEIRRYAFDHSVSIAELLRGMLISNKVISSTDKLFA